MHVRQMLTTIVNLCAVLAVPMVVLWDWPHGELYYILFHVIFIVSLLCFVGFLMDSSSGNGAAAAQKHPLASTGLNRALTAWFAFSWAAMLLAIVSHRETWSGVQHLFFPIKWLATLVIPAVSKVPTHMASEGFDARIAVTELAASVGYLSACALAAIFFFFVYVDPKKNVERAWTRRIQENPMNPFIYFVFGFCFIGFSAYVFLDPMISEKRLLDREVFYDFETSDLSLFFRMSLLPATAAFVTVAIPGFLGVIAKNSMKSKRRN